jgi:hypothetical protein
MLPPRSTWRAQRSRMKPIGAERKASAELGHCCIVVKPALPGRQAQRRRREKLIIELGGAFHFASGVS